MKASGHTPRDEPKLALGELLESFVSRVAHPRGQVLAFMTRAPVTVPQAVLLDRALRAPGSTPSSLAAAMKVSLPSVSQMVDRLVKLGYLERTEDARDRRRRELRVTPPARAFLARLRAVRAAEFEAGTAALSADTRRRLANALARAAGELADA